MLHPSNQIQNFQQLETQLYSNLRSYQKEGISAIQEKLASGKKSVLRQAFTGTGKSVEQNYFAVEHLAQNADNVYLFLIHREELIDNAADYFHQNNIAVSYLKAGRRTLWNTRIFLASVGSLQGKRLESFSNFVINKKLLIVCDEVHHAKATTWKKVLEAFPDASKIGFTATPERSDGQGFDDLFEGFVEGNSYQWYIDQKYLAPFSIKVPEQFADFSNVSLTKGEFDADEQAEILNDDEILGDVVKVWNDFALGLKTVVFTPKIYISKLVADKFNTYSKKAFGRDIAVHLDGSSDKQFRKDCLARFKLPSTDPNSLLILTNVALFSEGVNVPACSCTYWLTKYLSEIFYDQGNGRSNRYEKDKTQIIIDAVGNTLIHGLPNRPRKYSLEGRKKQELKNKYRLICNHCNHLISEDTRLLDTSISWIDCPQCDTSALVPRVTPTERKKVFQLKCVKCAKLLSDDFRKVKTATIECSCGEVNIIPQQEVNFLDTKFVEINSENFEHINHLALFKKYERKNNKLFFDELIKYPEVSLTFLQKACDYRGLNRSSALSAWYKVLARK